MVRPSPAAPGGRVAGCRAAPAGRLWGLDSTLWGLGRTLWGLDSPVRYQQGPVRSESNRMV